MIRDRIVERLIKSGQVTRLCAKAGFQLQGQESLSKEGPKCIQGPNSCGRGPCSRHLCPAKDSECHKCHKWGHYSAQCLSKSVREICDPPESLDDFAFLNTIGSDRDTFWACTISVRGQDTLESRSSQRSMLRCSCQTWSHPPSDFMGQTDSPWASWVKSKPHSHTKRSKHIDNICGRWPPAQSGRLTTYSCPGYPHKDQCHFNAHQRTVTLSVYQPGHIFW